MSVHRRFDDMEGNIFISGKVCGPTFERPTQKLSAQMISVGCCALRRDRSKQLERHGTVVLSALRSVLPDGRRGHRRRARKDCLRDGRNQIGQNAVEAHAEKRQLRLSYDKEADVLYFSFGAPRKRSPRKQETEC